MSNTIDTSRLLQELRASAAQLESNQPPATANQPSNGIDSFANMLSESISKVNVIQQESSSLASSFEMGVNGVTLPQVMVAKAKAGVAFEGMVQVRNRMVSAYQEIMQMRI